MDLSSKDNLRFSGGQREIESNKDEKQQPELTDSQMTCTDEVCGLANWRPLHNNHEVREAS